MPSCHLKDCDAALGEGAVAVLGSIGRVEVWLETAHRATERSMRVYGHQQGRVRHVRAAVARPEPKGALGGLGTGISDALSTPTRDKCT